MSKGRTSNVGAVCQQGRNQHVKRTTSTRPTVSTSTDSHTFPAVHATTTSARSSGRSTSNYMGSRHSMATSASHTHKLPHLDAEKSYAQSRTFLTVGKKPGVSSPTSPSQLSLHAHQRSKPILSASNYHSTRHLINPESKTKINLEQNLSFTKQSEQFGSGTDKHGQKHFTEPVITNTKQTGSLIRNITSNFTRQSEPHEQQLSNSKMKSSQTDLIEASSCLVNRPKGLYNIGNTCYMNAILQCFIHTTHFVQIVLSCGADSKATLFHTFQAMLKELVTTKQSPPRHAMFRLKSKFGEKHREFLAFNQQDAAEFMRYFIMDIHESLSNPSPKPPLQLSSSVSEEEKADKAWKVCKVVYNSPVSKCFMGMLKSTVVCTGCNTKTSSFDPIWELSLSFPSSARQIGAQVTLNDCLDLLFSKETLSRDNKLTCDVCKSLKSCTKQFTIAQFPTVLVLTLKRFTSTFHKIDKTIEIPFSLNLGKYAMNGESCVRYELFAAVNHIGSLYSGHYTAICKNKHQEWHHMSDLSVSEKTMKERSYQSREPYILFYESVTHS